MIDGIPWRLFATALILNLGAGCGNVAEPDGSAPAELPLVLHRGNGGDPGTLDPFLAEDVHAFNVLRDLYEGLVAEAADGTLIPGVAERWDISDDGLTYTFYLRDDAVWSNGSPVTAGEFVAGFRRVLGQESQSPYAFLLEPIANSAAVSSGDLPATELGIRAADSSTLEMRLSAPTAYFPGILAMPVSFPLHRGEQFDSRQFAEPAHFVGNGPYLLSEWRLGSKIILKKNPRFRNADRVAVQHVEYFPVEDPATEFNMYRAGELDITATVPPARMDFIRQTLPGELKVSPQLALYYIAFDLTEPPMNNELLRRALNMAVDRDALVEIIGRGEQPAYGVVPDGVRSYAPARYDWQTASGDSRKQRARELYAAAGYAAENPLALSLLYDVGDIHETVALAVSSMWEDVLGVTVTLEKREWMYFLETRQARDEWQTMRFSWFGDYNDASTFLDIFRTDSPQNLPAYGSPRFDEIIKNASLEVDPVTRAGYLHEAEALLLEATPVVPLYFFVNKHLVSPRVRNFERNVLDVHQSQYIELTATDE